MSAPQSELHSRLHFRWPLIGLALFTALGAISGGLAMVVEPSGRLLGWTPAMLDGTPFGDYLGPGLILMLVLGVGHLVVSVGLLLGRRSALRLAALAGAALVIWILVQLGMIGFFWLQAVMLGVGVAELTLGLLAFRAHAPDIAPDALRMAERFLVLGRVAFVGLSREPHSFSRQLADAMKRHGLDVVGVNPKEPRASDVPMGERPLTIMETPMATRRIARPSPASAVPSGSSSGDPPDPAAALRGPSLPFSSDTVSTLAEVPDLYRRFVFVLVPADHSLEVTREAIAAGARHVWFHQGAGPGCASAEALAAAQAAGLEVVSGLCPFMLLDADHWMHGLHRDLRLGALVRVR